MKKKLPFIFLLLTAACTTVKKDSISKQMLITADSNFSQLCKEKGMKAAFIAYADEEVIKPYDGKLPAIGKAALIQTFEGKQFDFTLTWKPVKVEISNCGDLGYTFGNWRMVRKAMPDSILYGNYITIWKKQTDGSWKYVFDTGNSTPEPANTSK